MHTIVEKYERMSRTYPEGMAGESKRQKKLYLVQFHIFSAKNFFEKLTFSCYILVQMPQIGKRISNP